PCGPASVSTCAKVCVQPPGQSPARPSPGIPYPRPLFIGLFTDPWKPPLTPGPTLPAFTSTRGHLLSVAARAIVSISQMLLLNTSIRLVITPPFSGASFEYT